MLSVLKEIKCGLQISGVHMVINFHLTLGVEGILNFLPLSPTGVQGC